MKNYEKNLFDLSTTAVVVQAGGAGSGMWDYTKGRRSKNMIKIGPYPAPHWAMIPFYNAGFRYFILTLKEFPDQIMDYFKNGEILGSDVILKYVNETEENPLGRLGCIEKAIKDEFLITPSQHIIQINACDVSLIDVVPVIDYHRRGLKNGYLATQIVADSYIIPGGEVEVDKDGRTVKRLVEGARVPTRSGRFINAAIWILSPSAINILIENIDSYPVNIEGSKGLDVLYESKKVQCYKISGKNFYQHKRMRDINESRKIYKSWAKFFGIKL